MELLLYFGAGEVVFLFIFTGQTPVSFFINTIKAINGSTNTINFYVDSVELIDQGSDFGSGWWQEEKIKDYPDLGPDADILNFSDENSVFYAGGNYSVVLGNFVILEEDEMQNEVKMPEEQILSDFVSSEFEEITSTGTEEYVIEDDFVLNSPESILASSSDELNISSTSLDILEDEVAISSSSPISTTSKSEDFETIEDDTYKQVEIFKEHATNTDEVIIEELEESSEETTVEIFEVEIMDELQNQVEEVVIELIEEEVVPEGEVISWLDGIKNKIEVLSASAQEFLNEKIIDLNELGEFKSANLKLSMAVRKKTGNYERENISIEETVFGQDETENAQVDDAKVIIWYSFENNVVADTEHIVWHKLDTISGDDLSNAVNGDKKNVKTNFTPKTRAY